MTRAEKGCHNPASMSEPPPTEDRDRLEQLHLALEGALEQLTHAQRCATLRTEIAAPPPEVQAIERLLGELTLVRNQVRERLMKLLGGRASMTVLK